MKVFLVIWNLGLTIGLIILGVLLFYLGDKLNEVIEVINKIPPILK